MIQQIHNTLVARQILPKGPDQFELVFHFFGYEDDTPELRALRIKQANLVGPAGYISMEDTEATELVQRGTVRATATTLDPGDVPRRAGRAGHADQREHGPPLLGRLPAADGVRRAGVPPDDRGRPAAAAGDAGAAGPLRRRLDEDRLEDWPALFVEDCLYEIIAKENEDAGLPAPLIRCDSAAMLRDRVVSLRHANIYEKPHYRHMLSGTRWRHVDDGTVAMRASYVVVNTSQAGDTIVYQAGRYEDRLVRTRGRLALQVQARRLRHAAGADPARLPDLTMPPWTATPLAADDLVEEDGARVTVGGLPVALFRWADGCSPCTTSAATAMARLSDGYVEDGCVECPLHQGLVDIRTGAPRTAPVSLPVRSYPARLRDGRVEVSL